MTQQATRDPFDVLTGIRLMRGRLAVRPILLRTPPQQLSVAAIPDFLDTSAIFAASVIGARRQISAPIEFFTRLHRLVGAGRVETIDAAPSGLFPEEPDRQRRLNNWAIGWDVAHRLGARSMAHGLGFTASPLVNRTATMTLFLAGVAIPLPDSIEDLRSIASVLNPRGAAPLANRAVPDALAAAVARGAAPNEKLLPIVIAKAPRADSAHAIALDRSRTTRSVMAMADALGLDLLPAIHA